MTDLADEIMSFLCEDDILELKEKAGVRFPLGDLTWSDLSYVCCWMGMKRELPGSIHNRMVLGEKTPWTEIYLKMMAARPKVSELFDLAG